MTNTRIDWNKPRQVYRLLWERGPLTKSALEELTSLKLTTLVRTLSELQEQDLIYEYESEVSTGGRKPFLYDIKPNSSYVIGVDISRTHTKAALMNLRSEIVSMKEFGMDKKSGPYETIERLSEIIRAMATQHSVLGICIGSVGPFDRQEGILLNPMHFLAPGWENIPLAQEIQHRTGLPVFLESGANCAVMAEYLYGFKRRADNIGYIHLGMGIRSGIVQGGRLVRSATDRDDLLGHITIQIGGKNCDCGHYGCLEAYCSIGAMLDSFTTRIKSGRTACPFINKAPEDITYSDLFLTAHQGDPLAREVILEGAAVFGNGIANYCNLLGLHVVIISGPVVEHSELFFDECTRIASKQTFHSVKFSHSHFHTNTIVMGAGVQAVYRFLLEGDQ